MLGSLNFLQMVLHDSIGQVCVVQAELGHPFTSIAKRCQSMVSRALHFVENCLVILADQNPSEIDAAAIDVPVPPGERTRCFRIASTTTNLLMELSCSRRQSRCSLDEKVFQLGVLDFARSFFEAVVAVLEVFGQVLQDGDDFFLLGGLVCALAMFLQDWAFGELVQLTMATERFAGKAFDVTDSEECDECC